ncbi:Hexokinase-1 [Paramyrothecium foliicola]|nr:Hexokinase-1 [Paramyrothecium foliicola]
MALETPLCDDFLRPLRIDLETIDDLSHRFLTSFTHLSAESDVQFLPTPISESILRPVGERGHGRNLAIDIGGSNLRVGFVELLGKESLAADSEELPNSNLAGQFSTASGRVQRHLERAWPIDDHLKSENADGLFLWIGQCIAEVVREGCNAWSLSKTDTLSLGVTFSFPMVQTSLSEATLMAMGKGFALSYDTDLGSRLVEGYNKANSGGLPAIRVAAIANDSVSTLVSFIFKYDETALRRPSMGIILGTGCNATIPLRLSQLKPSKAPSNVSVLPGEKVDEVKIAVNTEWSINGSAPPLREMGLITQWDKVLDLQCETPGFQPMEYMTAGRYLGELGRIIFVDYLSNILQIPAGGLPAKLNQRHSLSTTFLSNFKPLQPVVLLSSLKEEFPESTAGPSFVWTEPHAEVLYRIAKAIQIRAAGIIAAASVALLTLADEIPQDYSGTSSATRELGVGYTGGCIVHFQDYLQDCQSFLDELMMRRFGGKPPVKVTLSPCHDGGITGAGILVAAALSSRNATM